ncbi:MAG: ABC transporter ATP-binding protein [Candidatus Cloacimonadia bacterium]
MKGKGKRSEPILKRLIPYIWEEKWLFIGGFSMMLVTSFLRLFDPLIIAHILDVIVPNHNLSQLYLYAGLFIGLVLTLGILSYSQVIILSKMGIKIVTKLKFEVFRHLLQLPVNYFDKNPVGELMARVESDCENVRQLFSDLSVKIFGNLIFFVGILIVMFIRSWSVSLIILIPISIILVSVILTTRYLRKFFKRERELNEEITGIVTEYIQGVSIVQLFNQERHILDSLEDSGRQKRNVEAKAMFIEYGLWGVYDFVMETLVVVLLVYLIVPKILLGGITIGTLVIFIQYSQRIFYPLLAISENINQIQRGFVSLNRIFTLLKLSKEPLGEEENKRVTIDDKIEFRDVWFKYKEDEWVLKGVNFTVKKGEKVALVGASGSGKTTTVSLLCDFYRPQKGGIYVDGVELGSLNIREWRKRIGLVLQDIFLFPGDILENVRVYNDEVGEAEVSKALEQVTADSFVNKMPDGVYSEIKERGQNISVGEKQLISFARAIAFSPELVILDEATASIDIRTEAKIQLAMERLLEGKTAIVVAHRVSSIINSDKILLFDEGEIIAEGTHSELLKSSAEYNRLVQLQYVLDDEVV